MNSGDLDESDDDWDEEWTGAFRPLASPIPPESPSFCYKPSKRSMTGLEPLNRLSLNIWGLLAASKPLHALCFSHQLVQLWEVTGFVVLRGPVLFFALFF